MNKNNVDDFSFILGLFASDGNSDDYRVRFFCSEEEISFFKLIVMHGYLSPWTTYKEMLDATVVQPG